VFDDVSYPLFLFVIVSIFGILKDNIFFSRKKKGQKPTGILVLTAKNAGYSSVLEMLKVKGPDNLGGEEVVEIAGVSPKKAVASNKV
jgi:ABC-type Na+ efflux pump permease subunit